MLTVDRWNLECALTGMRSYRKARDVWAKTLLTVQARVTQGGSGKGWKQE